MKSEDRLTRIPDDHSLQQQFALAAFGCMNADSVIHISTSITTGQRLYAYMKEKGFKTLEEAKADEEAFAENVIKPNIADSLHWVDVWKGKTKGVVISPGAFEGCRDGQDVTWSQDAFMGMWLAFIDNKVTTEIMQQGWAYSDGAGEEYLHITCMQMGLRERSDIKLKDTSGNPLRLDEGLLTMAEAFQDLHERGLHAPRLAATLSRMLVLEERYAEGKVAEEALSPSTLLEYERDMFLPVKEEVMSILRSDYSDILGFVEKQKSADCTPLNVLVADAKKKAPAPKRKEAALPTA